MPAACRVNGLALAVWIYASANISGEDKQQMGTAAVWKHAACLHAHAWQLKTARRCFQHSFQKGAHMMCARSLRAGCAGHLAILQHQTVQQLPGAIGLVNAHNSCCCCRCRCWCWCCVQTAGGHLNPAVTISTLLCGKCLLRIWLAAAVLTSTIPQHPCLTPHDRR